VSTAIASEPAAKSFATYFLLRRLQSLSGVVFGGYLVVHLLINATLIEGGDVFQKQVDKIHSLPFLPVVEWTFIYLPILYHTFYGFWIIATGQPNVDRYRYGKNWFYLMQRISAIVLVFFMAFHILGMKGVFGAETHDALKFDPINATDSTARHFNSAVLVWAFVYPVGILAACYHLANGFWTAAITWGLTISAKSQRRWGLACGGLFIFTLFCGMTALVALVNHGSPPGAATLASVPQEQHGK
jgi:succinate dehydrogenase / fumarate reductase cytochrome b subunit